MNIKLIFLNALCKNSDSSYEKRPRVASEC